MPTKEPVAVQRYACAKERDSDSSGMIEHPGGLYVWHADYQRDIAAAERRGAAKAALEATKIGFRIKDNYARNNTFMTRHELERADQAIAEVISELAGMSIEQILKGEAS